MLQLTWFNKTLNLTALEFEPSVYRVNEIVEHDGSVVVPHELYCTSGATPTVFYRYNGMAIPVSPSNTLSGKENYQRAVLMEAGQRLAEARVALARVEGMFGEVEVRGRRLTVNCLNTTASVELSPVANTQPENTAKEKLRQIDYSILLREFPSDSKQAELLTALHDQGVKCPAYIDDREQLNNAGLTQPVFLVCIRPAKGVFSVNNNFIVEVADVYRVHCPASADAPREFKTTVEVIRYLHASAK